MIIVEGPDGGGKSTLVNRLSQEFQVPVHHSGGPPKSEGDIISRHSHMLENPRLIFDRAPAISDPIYGAILVRGSSLDAGDLLDLLALHPLVIYCRPPIEHLLKVQDGHEVKAHETQEHVSGVMCHQPEIIVAYDRLMVLVPHLKWDFLDPTNHRAIVSACARKLA